MTVNSLQQVFEHELEDIHFAERELVGTLEELEELVRDEDLKRAIGDHREETERHVERLDRVFEIIGKTPEEETCEAMEGILEEFREFKAKDPDEEVLELFSLVSIHKAEHYEIATYGNLTLMANRLGMEEAAQLLHDNLEEEEWFLNDMTRLTDEYDFDQIPAQAQ